MRKKTCYEHHVSTMQVPCKYHASIGIPEDKVKSKKYVFTSFSSDGELSSPEVRECTSGEVNGLSQEWS